MKIYTWTIFNFVLDVQKVGDQSLHRNHSPSTHAHIPPSFNRCGGTARCSSSPDCVLGASREREMVFPRPGHWSVWIIDQSFFYTGFCSRACAARQAEQESYGHIREGRRRRERTVEHISTIGSIISPQLKKQLTALFSQTHAVWLICCCGSSVRLHLADEALQ